MLWICLAERRQFAKAAAAATTNERVAAAQREARESASAAALDATAKIKEARAGFDSQLCEANRRVAEAEVVATKATARAAAATEKITRLKAELQEALRASHRSEVAESRGQLRKIYAVSFRITLQLLIPNV